MRQAVSFNQTEPDNLYLTNDDLAKKSDIEIAKKIVEDAKARLCKLTGKTRPRTPYPVPQADGSKKDEREDSAVLMKLRRRRNRPEFDPKV